MVLGYYCCLFFFPLVKIFHSLVIPGSPNAASDKQLCKGHSLTGGTAAKWQLVKGEFLGTEVPFCSFHFHIFIHITDACSKSYAGTAQAWLAS